MFPPEENQVKLTVQTLIETITMTSQTVSLNWTQMWHQMLQSAARGEDVQHSSAGRVSSLFLGEAEKIHTHTHGFEDVA